MASQTVVDTTNSTLQLFAGLHRDELNQIATDGMVRPGNVMAESERRSWVVLHTTIAAASDRALRWGFEELGKEQDELQLVLIAFEFTTLGVGHYIMQKRLTTHDWIHVRFHGDLPLLSQDMNGEPLVKVQ